jgi:ADP-ribose pyrophosphatase
MIKSRKIVFNGYYKMEELTVKLKSGKLFTRELFKTKDGVAAVIYNTKTDKYIFVKQWRPCNDEDIIEVVAGSIEKNVTPFESIRNEVLEETGFKCDYIKKLTEFYVSPGSSSEKVTIYYVEVSEKVEDGGGLENENEEVEIIEMYKDEVLDYSFKDAKTIICKRYITNN